MSSFFTLPASQKKRKRTVDSNDPAKKQRTSAPSNRPSRRTRVDDDDISSGDSNDGAVIMRTEDISASEEDSELESEDEAGRRTRLAERYLESTKKELLRDGEFDAAEIDKQLLSERMDERLKEDTAESKGKLYRWIASELDIAKAVQAQFRADTKAVTGIAECAPYIYTVTKDITLIKWKIPERKIQGEGASKGQRTSSKPKQLLYTKGNGKNKNDPEAPHHTGAILCVAASSDGRFVATGGVDRKLIVWDAATLKPLKFFSHHRDAVTSLIFKRGSNELFSTSRDRTIKIWSLNELAYVETLFGHQDEVVDVGALAAEKCVTVGARDRTARLWKVVEESQLVFRGGGGGKSRPERSNPKEEGGSTLLDAKRYTEGSIDRIALVDDDTFVTGSDNGSLSLWNVHKKKPVFTHPLAHGEDSPLPLEEASAELHPDPKLMGEPTPRWITALKAIPFSDLLVSGSWDGYIRAWKISDDKRRLEALGPIGCVEQSVEEMLETEGLSSVSIVNGALQAMKDAHEKQGLVRGMVNDLAVFERGERGKDGVAVLAAVGKEHRLGRWKQVAGKNCAFLFEISRNIVNEGGESEDAAGGRDEGGVEDFEGFD